jgi:hypothetical protein
MLQKIRNMTGVKKTAVRCGAVALVWLGIALTGYGLSLRALVAQQTVDYNRGEVRRGRVVIRGYGSAIDRVARFKLKDFDLEFLIPLEFFEMSKLPHGLSYYLQNGTDVTLKATFGGVVLDLAINPETPYYKNIVAWGYGTTLYPKFIQSRYVTGSICMVIGWVSGLLGLLGLVASVGIQKLATRMKR